MIINMPKKKGKAQPAPDTPTRQNLNDKLDKVDEGEAALVPNTPLGKLLASISDTMDTMNTINRVIMHLRPPRQKHLQSLRQSVMM
jgi:hypothetical protein